MSYENASVADIKELQTKLKDLGFGNLEINGEFDKETKVALDEYENYLRTMPLEPKPWWTSMAMKSTVTVIIGGLGMFIPFLKEIDTAILVDVLFNIGQHIDILIQMIGVLLAMFGVGGMAIGRIKATQPIDKTKVLPGLTLKSKKMSDVDKWLDR